MTSRSMRQWSAAVLVVAALALSGCSFAAPPAPKPSESDTKGTEKTPSPEKTTDEDDDSDLPSALSFADGDDLPDGAQAQWGDSMMVNDEYTVASPDNGSGQWSYTHVASGCEISFYQGVMTDLDASQDDRAMTLELLGKLMKTTPDVAASKAHDVQFGYQVSGSEGVDALAIPGTNTDGSSVVVAARALHTVPAVVMVGIQCPVGVDAQDVFETVGEKDLNIIVMPPVG